MLISNMTISEASQGLTNKDFSALELLDATLSRLEEVNPTINAFIRTDPQLARTQAIALDDERSHGHIRSPLHGIPMAHKDMFYRKGVGSSCGTSVVMPLPTETSTALARLDSAGVVQFGVLNMAEFALGPTGHNWSKGHCRNPWNTERISGGSSSGSAASVAARVNFGALGSDTGGSIRGPAGMCGITGLKTTYGRVSRAGTMGLSYSLDTIGPLARSALDCAMIMNAVAGSDPADPSTWAIASTDYVANIKKSIGGLKLGIPTNYFFDEIDPEIDAAIKQSLATLSDLGCTLIPIALPDLVATDAAGALITACEAAALHSGLLKGQGDLYSTQVRLRIERGFVVSGVSYVNALRYRSVALKQFIDQVFSIVDVFIAPVLAHQTPEVETTDLRSGSEMDKLIAQLTRLTRPINYLGLPALAIPSGFTNDGMPISMQLVGRPFSEEMLLGLGHVYQLNSTWHKASPAIY
jgi:aspartyl-tRNA(Asn)/glutamyl-tRNA(Gln) amidotransferase subunit A